MGEEEKRLAHNYLEAFINSFATILGDIEVPHLLSNGERLIYIEQTIEQIIAAHRNMSTVFHLMDELTALRVKTAKKIGEHLTLIRGICEGEIPKNRVGLFAHRSLSCLFYSEELIQEAQDIINEL